MGLVAVAILLNLIPNIVILDKKMASIFPPQRSEVGYCGF